MSDRLQPAGMPRRNLLKGGALLIGFSLAGAARSESLGPFPQPQITGPSPDPNRIDTWFAVHGDNRVTLFIGKPDIGQGNATALSQIAAEELDVAVEQITVARQTSGVSPDQGEVDASSSVEQAGAQLRLAAAEARQALLAMAAKRLGAPVETLTVARGVVRTPMGGSTTYGELIGNRRFDIAFTGTAPVKSPGDYRIVGQRTPRSDSPSKVSGTFDYMQFVKVAGMLHGRVVRPRGQYAYGVVPKVLSVDQASIAGIAGARVVRQGDFVGVVAPREWDAIKAARALKVVWAHAPPGLAGHDKVFDAMQSARTQDAVVHSTGAVDPALASAAHVVEGRFEGAYQAHGPFAPHCAIADVRSDRAEVMSCSQGVYATRHSVSEVLPGIPVEKITVTQYEGSGTYGSSCYNDVAQCAAVMSRLAGAPVRVQFMRWDEFGWDNFGPAHLGRVKVAADAAGKITAYQYDGWQHGWTTYDAAHEFAAGVRQPLSKQDRAREVNKLNLAVMYDIPNRQLNNHHIDARDGFLRGYSLRSPLDLAQTFGSEQMIDELAIRLKLDPVDFRRRNISDLRWLGVLEAVTKAADWRPKVSGTARSSGPRLKGRGVGMGTHFVSRGAAVADVEVDRATGKVFVTQLWGALDAGLVVNPAIVEAQIIGMQTQTVSRMLFEEVTFDTTHVTSLDWNTYPVLRFDEHPKIHPIVVQQPLEKSTGAGEEVMGATAAAIANAVFDATGVRFHRLPLTAERVRTALIA
jgi:nicotinate dehydrogenase subunit B